MVPSPGIRILPVQQLNHPYTCHRHGAISRYPDPTCPTAKQSLHLSQAWCRLPPSGSWCNPLLSGFFLSRPNLPPPITDMSVILIQSIRHVSNPSTCYMYGAILCFPQLPLHLIPSCPPSKSFLTMPNLPPPVADRLSPTTTVSAALSILVPTHGQLIFSQG
jgi:hypothetical protein